MANILLLEDDLSLQYKLKNVLELHGHKIAVADNGKCALNILRYSTPDLIVADIWQSGMDGYDFLEKLKENMPYKQIPVVFLTPAEADHDRLRGFELGVISYLNKPIVNDELINQISSLFTYRNTIIKRTLYESNESQQPDFQFVKQYYDLLATMAVSPDFSIEKAAEALSMSTSTLKRRLINYLDSNFSDSVKQYRLIKAGDLLKSSDISVEQASILCGFRSLSYFSRSFKSAYGISPNQYRSEQNEFRHEPVFEDEEMDR